MPSGVGITWPEWLAPVREALKEGSRKEAEKRLRQLAKSRSRCEDLVAVGYAWEEMEDHREALKAFWKAISADERCAPAYRGSGFVLQKVGFKEKALEAYDIAAELEPDNPEVLADLGILQFNLGKLDDAEKTLARALVLNPNDPLARNTMAYIRFLHDDVDGAVADLEAAVEAMPNFASAHNNLAYLYLLRGQLDDARKSVGRALGLRPKLVRGLYNAGLVAWLDGDRDGAADLYAQGRRLDLGADDFAEHMEDIQDLKRYRPAWSQVLDELLTLLAKVANLDSG